MPQTKDAKDLLYALEFVQNYDLLDVLDAAEELARREGAVRLDSDHVQRALVVLAGKETAHA
jgi:hypothetical protein